MSTIFDYEGHKPCPGKHLRAVIHWFRLDLRLADNPALSAAARSGQPFIAVYILDDEIPWAPGGASRWWLHHSLAQLDETLQAKGSRLLLRRGHTLQVLLRLIEEVDAEAIYCTRCYAPHAVRLERELNELLQRRGVRVSRYSGGSLTEPEQMTSALGQPYQVFTPFWNVCRQMTEPLRPQPPPERIHPYLKSLPSERLADWALLPAKPDWAGGLRASWTPGERGAHERLQRFLDESATQYETARDRPDRQGTSRLSPHLHFGEISARFV